MQINLSGQSAADAAVQLSASVQSAPAQIVLSWITNTSTSQYQVFRKLKTATSWGSPVAILTGATGQFTDNSVTVGDNYEYKLQRSGSGYTGFGYINTGVEVPAISYRGKLILLVDSSFSSSLSPEISRLIADIEGDGWEVIRRDVDRNGTVLHVKSVVLTAYNLDPANTKAVFIVGHVPVPYSGNLNPDGHPDHLGAWPADVYYGDVNGNWTDVAAATTTASPARTQNLPGDGKFDQSVVPGDVELQVGRVDFSNLPAFASTEFQLLKNYLDKDHEYRKKIYMPLKRAVIDDNFGYFGSEAFAASGYKNLAPLVGQGNIVTTDYFTTMAAGSYLWSYGCGGGSFTSASGIGNTSNFAASSLQGVFTMLFGSYFGDWDSQNNFLRAPLAQGKVLTCMWSGRPHYQLHHMGLGENIGYGLIQTQNNPGGLYFGSPTGITGKWVHNALMGDPTLRNDVVAPVSSVVATTSGYHCNISWSATTETNIAGYNIYMKNDTNQTFVKINSAPIAGTTYTDPCLAYPGIYTYMVRALKLETTPSGSYYNMSEGIADTAYNSSSSLVTAGFTVSVTGNTVIVINNSSANASAFTWNFGNSATSTLASTSTTYAANGTYTISLAASNNCHADTAYTTVKICHWLAAANFSATINGDSVYFHNLSLNASTYFWDFGNGYNAINADPVMSYTPGQYTVSLMAFNECGSDTFFLVINITDVGITKLAGINEIALYPNPSRGTIRVSPETAAEIVIYNTVGEMLGTARRKPDATFDLSTLKPGIYFVRIKGGDERNYYKIILQD